MKNQLNNIIQTFSSRHLRPTPGLSSNNNGKLHYQQLLNWYLGTNLTAEEVKL